MIRLRTLILTIALAGSVAACQKRFDFALYSTNEEMFRAALAALNDGRYGAAASAFERLTLQLSARDSLLPRSYFYLGTAQMKNREWQLASNAFRRIYALFSTDTLADDGLLLAARASRKLWPNPELDSSYGEDAKALLNTLLQSYPLTPLREEVFKELDELDDAFASKDYEVAMGLFRNKAWGSSTMYAKMVIEDYPATPTALKARVLLVKAYLKLRFPTDAEEQCKFLRDAQQKDGEVLKLCGATPPPATIPP